MPEDHDGWAVKEFGRTTDGQRAAFRVAGRPHASGTMVTWRLAV